jgi:hypothetical protein
VLRVNSVQAAVVQAACMARSHRNTGSRLDDPKSTLAVMSWEAGAGIRMLSIVCHWLLFAGICCYLPANTAHWRRQEPCSPS